MKSDRVMTKAEKETLAQYIRDMADDMGLRDWTVEVGYERSIDSDDPWDAGDGPSAVATADCTPNRKLVEITFMFDPRGLTREELRQTCAHELTHPHFSMMWDQVRQDLLPQLGQSTYDIFIASFERNMEFGVDAIGDIIAENMPLIEWPGKR